MTTFNDLGLSDSLLNTLEAEGFDTPTPIQAQAIPHVLEGRDLMGLAQTGTGKTAAFGLPLIHKLVKAGAKPAPRSVRGLILAPTRELAKQIADTLSVFTRRSPLKVGLVVGGASINMQVKRLEKGTDILVATPGRLIDLLDRRSLSLAETQYLVLDEADQMLDMGFIHALRKIAALLPAKRQTLLFSATMPKLMAELAGTYLKDPIRVEVSPPGKVADKITQTLHYVEQGQKGALLREMLEKAPNERALVFCRTKHGAERLMKQIVAGGLRATSIHGNKSQGQRERSLSAFRDGSTPILVATDVAARGIDIPDVLHVYNFDLPNVPDNYVHRIGRTARAGAEGRAVAFCCATEMEQLWDIEKTMGMSIPVASGSAWAPQPQPKRGGGAPKGQGQRGGAKPGGGNGGKRRRPRRGSGGKARLAA
ncbi:DEAD/DEAH box helicase [Oceanibium sediminis]|uniref:DEAD/DEAH box helicase n=1 Tax=Oceanibium sediminis TaxID=2026339 RepID=UPI000DD4A111|nr:DEAD/DEAH box helicase [Oceanibium sediminis]